VLCVREPRLSYVNRLRKRIRDEWGNDYIVPSGGMNMPRLENPRSARLLLTLPVLERIRTIEGWLADAEGDLLMATVTRALTTIRDSAVIVEIGSYCGKSTIAIGSAAQASDRTDIKVYAIDPHDGIVGALDQGLARVPPSLERFRRNIADAGLTCLVETVEKRSFEVEWNQSICLLFIDGLHDYANVARDFYHFEHWVASGGFVAFHDYADYYPGVKVFVDELLAGGRYEKFHQALSMIVVRKAVDADVHQRHCT
jgi:hypothetical protein